MRSAPRRSRLLCSGLAVAAAVLSISGVAQAAYEDPTMALPRETSGTAGLGPHFPYVQVIPIGGGVPLVNQAVINRTANGYLFRAGQQDSNITVTVTGGRLRFVDVGTQSWKWLPQECERLAVLRGVGASCLVPTRFSVAEPMLVEIWPRLGNDVVDTMLLPERFDVAFLGDDGKDVAHLGPGNDFVNGAEDGDRAYGGEGRDVIRTGMADDFLDGGPGDDYLAGVDANDALYGGQGDDRMYGGNGDDALTAGEGRDALICGVGTDTATYKSTDRTSACEHKNVR